MIGRDSFNQSRAQEFVESIAMERNIETQRSIMTIGISNATIYTDMRVRASDSSPRDIHTTIRPGEIALGQPGVDGAISIGGSGWARISLRVKGVACKIPPGDYEALDSEQSLQPMGAPMMLTSPTMFVSNSITATITRQHGFPSYVEKIAGMDSGFSHQRRLVLNLFDEQDEYTDQPSLIDRIVSVSAQLPVLFDGVLPNIDWIGLTLGGQLGSTYGSIFTGGTAEELDTWAAVADLRVKLGTAALRLPVCDNPGINTTNLLPPYGALFSNPSNIVQLQVQLIGWRPDTIARPEAYHDLVAP